MNETPQKLGWPTGFEPATTRSTIWGSNQAELRPPANAREANFLCSQRQAPSRAGDQAPNSKLQAPKKHQVPNTKLQTPEKLQARSAGGGLELGTWDFFGVWSLVFGVSIPGFLWSLVFGVWCFAQRQLKN
jgi:hypothetical protein